MVADIMLVVDDSLYHVALSHTLGSPERQHTICSSDGHVLRIKRKLFADLHKVRQHYGIVARVGGQCKAMTTYLLVLILVCIAARWWITD